MTSPGDASPWPASILLAEEGYVAGSRNDTTAIAKSRVGHTVQVTFWIADPPAVSFYTFHCSKPRKSDPEEAELQGHPRVVGAEGRFVLVRTLFAHGDGGYEFFLYKGDPRSPSLESVPLPDDYDTIHGARHFGILPRGDGHHYLLVALCDSATFKDYRLLIYSSEDRTWQTKELLNPCPGLKTITPDKVMLLRDGMLVWVDSVRGILVCDVLQEPLHARFIPLPQPLPGNTQESLERLLPGACSIHHRDVSCVNGLIKFVEVEHRVTVTEIVDVPPEKPSEPRNTGPLYDSDLIKLMLIKPKRPLNSKPRIRRSMNGWSAVTWTREFGSDCWLNGNIVDVDDILVDDPALSTFKNKYLACPILSTDGNDILYLKSSTKLGDSLGWGLAIDLTKKTLKVEAPEAHPFGRYFSPSLQILFPCGCALVNYLKRTPGIKVSEIQIAQTDSSENEPNNTAICVGEPDSHESENKRPRLSAEKVNHAQDGAQRTVQNVLSSQTRPDQKNMPPQLCFNRWEQPGYGGYSPCPPQNNPPLPQYFNPVYAPAAPVPNISNYGNYQPLWQQPPLPGQQTTTSRASGPHVAPHPYFNYWRGASHHGNSQQNPAGNSYSYGAHSGSGNQGFSYRPIYHNYRY